MKRNEKIRNAGKLILALCEAALIIGLMALIVMALESVRWG